MNLDEEAQFQAAGPIRAVQPVYQEPQYSSEAYQVHKGGQRARSKYASDDDGHSSAERDRSPGLLAVYPQYNTSDPFHCTVLGHDATTSMHLVAEFGDSPITRLTFLGEALAPHDLLSQGTESRHDVVRQARLRACIDNELMMCSSIAHISSRIAWTSGRIGDERSHYFLGKTMQAVRKHLEPEQVSASHTALVMSMFTLALTSLWSALPRMWQQDPYEIRPVHFKACKMHLRALMVLIDQGGGWTSVGPYILEGLIIVDKYVALYDMSRPLIPLTWAPGRLPPGSHGGFHLNCLPSSNVVNLLRTVSTDSRLTVILQDLAEFVSSVTAIWAHLDCVTSEIENWLYLRFNSICYRFLLFQPRTAADNCIRITALLFQLNILPYVAGTLFSHVVAIHLLNTVVQIDLQKVSLDPEVRFWCLCTGAMVRRLSKEKQWFVAQLHKLVRQTRLPLEMEAWQKRLEGYLYMPSRQSSDLRDLLQAVAAARQPGGK